MATSGADLRKQLGALTNLVGGDLAKIWSELGKAALSGDALFDLLPALIDQYGTAAATITADWYDELRVQVAVKARFTAIPADIKSSGAEALVGWAKSQTTDPDVFKQLVLAGTVKRIRNYSRQTVMGSSVADPSSGGWYRTGAGECDFCRFLIGRGAVYSEDTADFASHDHCKCGAAPTWKSTGAHGVLLDASGRRLTHSTRASRTDDEQRAADNERVRAWIAEHPNVG